MEMCENKDASDILAVRAGNSAALERLLATYEPLIASSVHSVTSAVTADEF